MPFSANRLRITALVSLAMVNVCALGAGVAVARLLPGRLSLWNIPRVAAAPLVAGGQVLRPAQSAGALPTSHGLSAALAPILASRALGSARLAVERIWAGSASAAFHTTRPERSLAAGRCVPSSVL